jgi:lipoprotein-anchoring transpeptidase ErfK/SrfK
MRINAPAPSAPAAVAPQVAPPVPSTRPRPVKDVLEAQLVLARQAISSGSLDGVLGSQTRAALRAFQRQQEIPVTGQLDARTRQKLLVDFAPFTSYTVTSPDQERLLPVSSTWLGKSQQPRLDYETILELVAEKAWSHPRLIERLNPDIDWRRVRPGQRVTVPNVRAPTPRAKASHVVIRLGERSLQAFNQHSRLLAHFPCSIARSAAKRPVGALNVKVVIPKPNYTFNPAIFRESAEGRRLGRKLVIPPGPNNPVGVVWIGLDKPGYGIHGTPSPEQVGRTESHGCFRLANWNAEYLAQLVSVGTLVVVNP